LSVDPKLEPSWKNALSEEFRREYFVGLKQFLMKQKELGKGFYPPGSKIFEAFRLTPFNDVKVVILGQDPYHGPNQAHGLCFSVQEPTKPPPSLINIFKELENDLGFERPLHGNLSSWALQGVFLLNTVLTVSPGKAGSHRKQGWENFTNAVIRTLSEKRDHLVFILWGRDAQTKESVINGDHCIIKSVHPSPLSAHNGFFGSRPFSRSNEYLKAYGLKPVNWSIG
tara:strand:- start:245 stop:922 length:678 start_codon:yes stop_codon:yes gene_type:complete